MDHEEVVQIQAIDRYFLGQMRDEERDAFEQHFFSCPQCAEEVRLASTLLERAKPVLREPVRQRWIIRWRLPVAVPVFAAAALAAVVVYQNSVTIPGLLTPRSVSAAIILDGSTRAGLPRVKAGAPLRFQMAADGLAGSRRLHVELTDTSGRVVRGGLVDAPGPNQPLDVYFPGRVEPGRYAVVVRQAPAGRELARDGFEVVNEEIKGE